MRTWQHLALKRTHTRTLYLRTENDEGHDVDVEIKKANPFCEYIWLHDRPPDNVSVLAVYV